MREGPWEGKWEVVGEEGGEGGKWGEGGVRNVGDRGSSDIEKDIGTFCSWYCFLSVAFLQM